MRWSRRAIGTRLTKRRRISRQVYKPVLRVLSSSFLPIMSSCCQYTMSSFSLTLLLSSPLSPWTSTSTTPKVVSSTLLVAKRCWDIRRYRGFGRVSPSCQHSQTHRYWNDLMFGWYLFSDPSSRA
ncbi:hypothetical protein BDZ89DRAFT_1169165, partial [Hymenopellis radicata]